MEVKLTPEQQAKLDELASQKGCAADSLAREAIGHFIEEESRFAEAVRLGEAELERGEYLTSEEVRVHIEQLLRS